jgi:hypothetical protein
MFYRVIKKSLCTWWLQYRKLQVMFKASPASLQTFIDMPNCFLEDRVQYSTVHIPNVFCDGHLQLINCVGIVRIHGVFHHTPEKKNWAGDTWLTLMPSVIPNSNYVIMVGDWNCLKYILAYFLYCNRQEHRDFLITLHKAAYQELCSLKSLLII